MTKPRILILSFSDLTIDPRVNRQLQLLRADYNVVAAGFVDPKLEGVEFVALPSRVKSFPGRLAAASRLLLRRYESYYWGIDSAAAAIAQLRGRAFDIIIANDSNTWPLAVRLRGSARLLFDAHEYAPRELEDVRSWRLLYQPFQYYLCRTYLPQADGVVTVCAGLANEYQREFGISCEVVMNAPPRRALSPVHRPDSKVRIIHHGAAIPSRHLESMIAAMDRVDDRFQLDLMLTPQDPAYLDALTHLAASKPRVRMRPPVPMPRIPEEIHAFDIGLFLLPPVNFNYRHALPNKLFEFIQARLAIAIGPSPEMAALVKKHDCGIVAPDFRPESLARELLAITPEALRRYKENSHQAAQLLCWEHEGAVLRNEVDRLLGLGRR